MVLKGKYQLKYKIKKEIFNLEVLVELKCKEGILNPFENIYFAECKVNNNPYVDNELKYCVNAFAAAERIGKLKKEEVIAENKKLDNRVKIIEEIIK